MNTVWTNIVSNIEVINLATIKNQFKNIQCIILSPTIEQPNTYKINNEVIFLAVFKLTLSCYSAQENITIGYRNANLIGNTLLQSIINNESSTHDFLKLISSNLTKTLQNTNEDIIKWLANIEYKDVISNYFFTNNIKPTDDTNLKIALNYITPHYLEVYYDANLFNSDYINSFVQTYQTILQNIQQDIKLKEINYINDNIFNSLVKLPTLTNEELHNNLYTLQALFEQQVHLTPNNIALKFEETILTYSELNQHANQLAHYLQHKYAIKPNDLIAIALKRNELMIITILGILKSGAAYVPLDPSYPIDRIKYILDETKAKCLIINSDYHKQINISQNIDYMMIDNEYIMHLLATMPIQNPINSTQSNDLAYIIYTSGTTGKPKGVMIEHGGVVNLVNDLNIRYNFSSPEVVLQFANYVFDASIEQIWLALGYGHTLLLIKEQLWLEPEKFINYLISNNVTHIDATSSLLEQFEFYLIPSLKRIISGGEHLSEIQRQKISNNNQVWLINEYGPTEATIICVVDTVNATSIGKAINNMYTYVLDKYLRPLPIGAIGELYIGGIGIAQGYLNRDDLTSKVFIQNPFIQDKNIIYKTGDLVRYTPELNIEYIGRNDFQVKIRGYRIELSEIEQILAAYPEVKQSVILIKEVITNNNVNKYIMAYYVATHKLNEVAILQHLKQHLPEYMIPQGIIYLKNLPLTINGKLDRKTLLELANTYTSYTSSSSPVTEQEIKICTIIANTLGIPINQVGIHDDFFYLGGNSILAIKLIKQLKTELNLQYTVVDLFSNRTVAKLLATIPNSINEQTSIGSFELSPFEDTILKHQLLLGNNDITYNEGDLVTFKTKIPYAIFYNACTQIINNYPIFNSNYQFDDEKFIRTYNTQQLICEEITLPHYNEIFNLLNKLIKTPFDITKDKLIRFYLIHIDKKSYCYIISHHAISDATTTINILLPELYYLITNNQSQLINDKNLDFNIFKNKLYHTYYQNVQNKKDYWTQLINNADELNLGTQINQLIKGKHHSFEFNNEQRKSVIEEAKLLNVSEFSILFAIFSLIINKFYKTNNIAIRSNIDERILFPEHLNTAGCFINNIFITSNINNNFADYIRLTQQSVYDAINNLLPFNEILDINRDKTLELSKIHFNLETQELQNLEYEQTQIYTHSGFIKNDLYFELDIKSNSILGRVEYNPQIFDDFIIKNIIKTYSLLLDSLHNNINHHINQISLIDQSTYQYLIYDLNKTNIEFKKNITINELFEQQVNATPDNLAIITNKVRLTYQQINEKVNQLAHYLIKYYKINADTPIALCLERDETLLIAILAVLKAGGAYVPISPNFPLDRIKYIIKDANTRLILTNSIYGSDLSDTMYDTNVAVLNFKNPLIDADIKKESIENPNLKYYDNNLAYIIYTSGTTGKPKGVMLEHSAYIGVINSIKHTYFKTEHYISTYSMTNYVFDIFGLEYGLPLLSGGCITLGGPDIESLDCSMYNFIQMTPSLCNIKLDELINMQNTKLLIGGEALPFELLKKITTLNIELINVYGPTETAIWSTSKYYSKNSHNISRADLTIGKPLINESCFILDDNLNLLPQGAIGELCIGGNGLARGYLNLDDLTQNKFVTNPFYDNNYTQHSYRIYRTGDIVKYNQNNEIEFIGRNDSQIKINGFRIETSEIENVLLTFPGIKHAVALILESKNNDKYLALYYVAENKYDENILFSHLSQLLPDYMLPKALIFIESLPLTINGKLDKKALPTPDIDNNKHFTPPSNELEHKIANIWATILKYDINKISIHDSFFRLGGNSLLAIKVVKLINDKFNLQMNSNIIFKYTNIAHLVNFIEQHLNLNSIEITSSANTNKNILSFSQQRLLFIEQFEQNSNYYNIPILYKLSPEINLNCLKQALIKIINRHEVLHTIYNTDTDGVFYQKAVNLADNIIQINEIQFTEQQLKQDFNYIFNLTKEIPIKITIYTTLNEGYYLGVNIHHIAFDGWSIDIFSHELNEYYNFYQAQLNGKFYKTDTNELSIQYKDYAIWQNEYIKNNILDEQLKYWLNRLNGYENLNLPTDYLRTKNLDYAGNNLHFTISQDVSQALKKLAQELNISLYTLMLSGFYITLNTYTNQSDIVVGTPVANRHYPNLEQLIGCFINNIVIRATLNVEDTLYDFIQQLSTIIINSLINQDLPFEILVDKLNVTQDTSRHPIFQVLFSLQNFGQIIDHQKAIQICNKYDDAYNIAKFDLSVFINDATPELQGYFNYRTSLFNEQTIQNIINTYQIIITQFSELFTNQKSLNVPIYKLAKVSYDDYHRLIYTLNNTFKPYPETRLIHEMFVQQVEKTPNNTAIIYENKALTYLELNNITNQLAFYLLDKFDITPDNVCAICLERSEYMLIAIQGILKSGGAYTPLAPDFPNERKQYIIQDTKAKVIITCKKFSHEFNNCSHKVIIIDDILEVIAQYPISNPLTNVQAHNLAYVLYTSGTTGNPKGVMLEHSGIINRIKWMNDTYPLTENDKILQKTPYIFDVSVWELFWGHWYGATIVFAKPEGHKDPDYLIDLISQQQISILHFVPSMLSVFEDVLEYSLNTNQKNLSSIRYIFCSGEALTLQQVKKCHNLMPHVQLHNLYGPTEVSIDVLAYDCSNHNIKQVYIGKPIDNTTVYILGKYQEVLPQGAIGELYIGGVQLARGYMNLKELTKEKFINNPFLSQNNLYPHLYQNKCTRLYKTGDLARVLPDGNIEYIGRNDFQVKINGFRIELSEIENALLSFSNKIKHAIALVVENLETKAIVSYYVANTPIPEQELYNHLANMLTEYMLPSSIIYLDHLPTTINGKLDRKALPIPTITITTKYIKPITQIEIAVCDICKQILHTALPIGLEDDFFKLGGDSILAIRFVSMLKIHLDKIIPVKEVFNLRSMGSIAKYLETNTTYLNIETYQNFSLINKELYQDLIKNTDDIYPTSYLQMGMLLEATKYSNGTYHDVFSYTINAPFNEQHLTNIWHDLANKHELLRAWFLTNEDGYISIISKTAQPEIQIYKNQDLNQLIELELKHNFNYQRAGLYRLLINIDDKKCNTFDFIFSFHHAITDGWSVASIINEFIQAYIHNTPINNNIHVRYAEYVRNEINAINDKTHMDFWKKYLQDYEYTPLKFKFDNVYAKNSIFTYDLDFSVDDANQIHHISKINGYTIDSIFLSAYFITLSRFLSQDDIVIGQVVNNRLEHIDGDKIFGLFLNTIPFRIKIDYQLNNIIAQVFNEKIKLINHKQIPYGLIRNLFKNDLYNFAFNFTHFHILDDSNSSVIDSGGFERTNIPFMLQIHQYEHDRFNMDIAVHDDFMDNNYLKYFATYYTHDLKNLIWNKAPLAKLPIKQDINKNVNIEYNFSSNLLIHELVEAQALKSPHNTAIIFDNKSYSYFELNKHANQLAHKIRNTYYEKTNQKLSPDTLIALCLNRSFEMMIAILAVLKAGAAYVPLDPEYPIDRINYILEDSQVKLVLTQSECVTKLEHIIQENIINIDDYTSYSNEIETSPETDTQANNLAYVIYTSGTTGNPKGVMQLHKNVHRLFSATEHQFNFTNKDVWTLFHSYVFDFSVWEIFGALFYGGTLLIPTKECVRDTQNFVELCYNHKVSVLNQTPVAFYNFLDSLSQTNISLNLRYVIFGGEALNIHFLTPWWKYKIEHNLNTKLINMYGITETTVHVTYKEIDENEQTSSNIGKPIVDLKAYVLDNKLMHTPIGVIGELYIAGAGLARGYLNNQRLTTERFIINPFATQIDINNNYTHMYKTGDLVRWLPNGDLEYIGRNDFQVKIRGFRIELGEIEEQLLKINGIKQCCVIAKTNANQQYLVAYYVLNTESLNANSILQELSLVLPDYMLPASLVKLQSLPLTINGKLDRKALPEPEFIDINNYIAPKTELEQSLCRIWEEILNLKQVGIQDDFFRIGGNSILAIKLTAKINQQISTTLKVADLFANPSINKIIPIILSNKNTYQPIIQLNRTKNQAKLFMIHSGVGGCEVYSSLASKLETFYTCYGVDAYNMYHDKPIDNLIQIANYYLDAINQYIHNSTDETYYLLGWSLGGQISLQIAAILEERNITNIQVILLDTLLFDEYMQKLTNMEYKQDLKQYLMDKYKAYGLTYVEQVLINYHATNKLIQQSITHKLKFSQITLLKAILPDTGFKWPKELFDYTSKLTYNNIDTCCNSQQIKVIQIENTSHATILEQEQLIADILKENIK